MWTHRFTDRGAKQGKRGVLNKTRSKTIMDQMIRSCLGVPTRGESFEGQAGSRERVGRKKKVTRDKSTRKPQHSRTNPTEEGKKKPVGKVNDVGDTRVGRKRGRALNEGKR